MAILLKRVYEKPAAADGTRVLVDRLWPRGLTKAEASIEAWFRDLAPSNELRKRVHGGVETWAGFRRAYMRELERPDAEGALNKLYELAHKRKRLTLLFASKDVEHNNAVVLKELLDGTKKPPTGTGRGALASSRERQARRMPRR